LVGTLRVIVWCNMKICLFSDIHGNGAAFEEAYPCLINENADLNIFLGDLCGYYFDEIEIYHTLKDMPNLVSLKGNHDDMLLSAVSGDKNVQAQYLLKYGTSMENFLNKDNGMLVDWLLKIPESYCFEDFDLMCCHGSPTNKMNGYVYPDTDLNGVNGLEQNNVFLGHTHYPMMRFIGDKMIVNPGSLGQPRQGGWPTYAVVTLPDRKVEFKEVHYDINRLNKILNKGGEKNSYLKDVLLRCYEKDKK